MLNLIWPCVIDQHFIRCSLSGGLSCNAMALSMADAVYPSPYDYHLPESLAPACGLSHDLHYLREFHPNDEFLTGEVLRHNFDLPTDDYTHGEHSYPDDCLFIDSFEIHTVFGDSATVHSDKAGDDDWGPLDSPKSAAKSASSGDFSAKAKYSKVKLGVSHLPMHQPGSKRI